MNISALHMKNLIYMFLRSSILLLSVASLFAQSTSPWLKIPNSDFVPVESVDFNVTTQAYVTVTFEGGSFYSGSGSWWSDFKQTDYKGSLTASAKVGGSVVGLNIAKVVNAGPKIDVEWGVGTRILQKLPVDDVTQVVVEITASKSSKNGVDMAVNQIKASVESIPNPYSETAFAVYGIAKTVLDGLFPGDQDGDRISSSQGIALGAVPNGVYVIFGSKEKKDYAKYAQNLNGLFWKDRNLSFKEGASVKQIEGVAYYVVKVEWSASRFKGDFDNTLNAGTAWANAFRIAEDAARHANLGIVGQASEELVRKAGEVELLKIQNLNKDAHALLAGDKQLTTKEAGFIKRQLSAYTEKLCIDRLTLGAKFVLGEKFTPQWQNSFITSIQGQTQFFKSLEPATLELLNRKVLKSMEVLAAPN